MITEVLTHPCFHLCTSIIRQHESFWFYSSPSQLPQALPSRYVHVPVPVYEPEYITSLTDCQWPLFSCWWRAILYLVDNCFSDIANGEARSCGITPNCWWISWIGTITPNCGWSVIVFVCSTLWCIYCYCWCWGTQSFSFSPGALVVGNKMISVAACNIRLLADYDSSSCCNLSGKSAILLWR